jgi:hypothetical protein
VTRGTHSLKPRGSKKRRLAVISAPLVTCAVVGAGVAISDGAVRSVDSVDLSSQYAAADVSAALGPRTNGASRDSDRTTAIGAVSSAAVLPSARGRRWTTAAVDLRSWPGHGAPVRAEVAARKRLAITGIQRNGFAQVLVGHRAYWVTATFLATRQPVVAAAPEVVGKPCPAYAGVESGLTAQAVTVLRAVCNAFPQITSYGGYSPHGEHSSGKAIDIMTSDVVLGTRIAEFLRAHAAELHLFDVIWRRHIFTPERASEGWRLMPSRGSANADHMNHVHVSVS